MLLVWGEPSDTVVEARHIKPAAEPIGPLNVRINRVEGSVKVVEKKTDLVELVAESRDGLTAREVAEALHGPDPSGAQVESARSKLNRRVKDGLLLRIEEGETIRYRKKAKE